MKKRTLTYTYVLPRLMASLLIFAMVGCVSDDTDFSDIINDNEKVDVPDIEIDNTDLAEPTEIIDELDNDYVENSPFTNQVAIVYNGTTATVSGDVDDVDVVISGAHVIIDSYSKEVEYLVSGSSSNGSLKIYSSYKFQLTLAGLTLTNPEGAAINNQAGKHMYVVLAPGSVNTITDGEEYASETSEDEKGAFFSEGQIVFSGTGELRVYGKHRHAIASDDYIIFRPGSKFYVNSTAGHGIKANDGIDIRGSVINAEVSFRGSKGINTDGYINVSGGRTTVITTGQSIVEGNDTTSCAAMKCDSTFTITAGTLRLKSTGMGGKAINATKNITIGGGDITAVTLGEKGIGAPKTIKSDEDIIVSAGKLFSYSAYSKPLDADGSLVIGSGWTKYKKTERFVILEY